MRIAADITPLHEPLTGVGTYTVEVVSRLAAADDMDVVGISVSWKGRSLIRGVAPPGVELARGPMAAQPLRWLWRRSDRAPIEWWTGPVDVVFGTNYVVPPSRRAARLAVVHDLTPWRFPEMCTKDTLAYPGLVDRAIRRGAHILTDSEWVAGEIVDLLGAPAERIHWAHLAPATSPSGDPARARDVVGGDRYVLALSTVEPRKAFPTLVEAFDGLAAEDPDVRLVIAGRDGWDAGRLAEAIDNSPAKERIVRLGYIDTETRADLLAGATVFAHPARYEGFGLPPLEALAAGVPTVATTAGSLPEVLGDAALLVEPEDATALAEALDRVLTDENLAKDLAARGPVHAGRFSWDETADAVTEALEVTVRASR